MAVWHATIESSEVGLESRETENESPDPAPFI